MSSLVIQLLRYPGGKQRIVGWLDQYLPSRDDILGKYIEPFLGGASVFFAVYPRQALLADINSELIDLYRGIRCDPLQVWEIYKSYQPTKAAYYEARDIEISSLNLIKRAARTLYLNRTCFKGMWRHNSQGRFNVGYGGQDRRWVIGKSTLQDVSKRLQTASLEVTDFEVIVDDCCANDFIFLDPPYRPGERETQNDHYVFQQFNYKDHLRLANALLRASDRGVRWTLTTSSHPDILRLYEDSVVIPLEKGTGSMPGKITRDTGEVLIYRNGENQR